MTLNVVIEDFFKLPWPNIAGFLTCLSLILFAFGPKLPFVVKFFGSGIQSMLGIADLREQLADEHVTNLGRFDHIDATLGLQDAAMKQHAEDSAIHNGRRVP